MTEFTFGLIKGECGVRVRFREYPSLQALTRMDWNNKEGKVRGPDKLPEDSRSYWDRAPALTDAKDKEMLGDFKQVAAALAKDLSDPDRIMSVTLASAAKDARKRKPPFGMSSSWKWRCFAYKPWTTSQRWPMLWRMRSRGCVSRRSYR